MILILVFLLVVVVSGTWGQQVSNPNWLNEYYAQVDLETANLPVDSVSYSIDGLALTLGKDGKVMRVWGRGPESKGLYPAELLEAVFARKIVFEKLDLEGGRLLWVFTGDKAGFIIELTERSVKLYQRFYDSFGFHNVPGEKKVRIARYPHRKFLEAVVIYNGQVESISVCIGSDLVLRLYLNGKEVAKQMCIFDVSRHQVRYEGKEGLVQGRLVKPVLRRSTISIDPNKSFQEILGFGGITSVMAYRELSTEGKAKWWQLLREYNLLIHREYPIGTQLKPDYSNWDDPEDASIHYYGDNFPNGEISDFVYNKRIQDMGGLVVFEFWALPPWAMDRVEDDNGNIMSRPNIIKYAEAMVDYCKTAKTKTGRPPDIVGIQNEVTQPREVWRDMTLALRKELDRNGFGNVKIHMHNSGSLAGGIRAVQAFKSYPDVWEIIDYAATNMYDWQQFFTDPDGFNERALRWKSIFANKPFLSTEICINNSRFQHDSYRLAFTMGQLYHKNLAMMDASVLMYCWLLLNGPQPTFDATRSLFRVDRGHGVCPVASSHQLRVFGSFSRKLLRATKRVRIVNADSDLLVTAFTDGSQIIVIVLNRGVYPRKMKLTGCPTFSHVEITDPYNENKRLKDREIVSKGGELIISGGQILTLF
jgi:hypothetical protein